MTTQENFEVKLPLFEGPFDLLLFFIERDELDIYDIPISTITNDFLAYIQQMEELNIEVASEFILVAATLMRIKSKMLLPRPQLDEQGNEIDPREELVRHLLEYKKYKSVVDIFHQMEETELQKEKRGNLAKELKALSETTNVEAELQDVTIFKLMTIFERVVKRFEAEKNKPVHHVVQYPYTVDGQKKYLISEVTKHGRLSFAELLETFPTRLGLIFNFLAILEMLAIQLLAVQVGEGFNNFWITKYQGDQLEISSIVEEDNVPFEQSDVIASANSDAVLDSENADEEEDEDEPEADTDNNEA
ncbi:segregation/condensation protein A [Fulvivirgaceae bacterium PWU5]|uniref:Segregation and condensation protein A n=1 Tax=Dawidia cretensis TaxID=2782350 RepID=A0AAP2DT50_9BACT|nr:segregation/condensation protein A [Dawidia cretensis]MBT1706866.1 segregation/condensation protein A [Dawidia cretensis]